MHGEKWELAQSTLPACPETLRLLEAEEGEPSHVHECLIVTRYRNVKLISQRARGFKLRLHLKLPILPVVLVQALLQRLANQLTSADFPSLQRDGLKGKAPM